MYYFDDILIHKVVGCKTFKCDIKNWGVFSTDLYTRAMGYNQSITHTLI